MFFKQKILKVKKDNEEIKRRSGPQLINVSYTGVIEWHMILTTAKDIQVTEGYCVIGLRNECTTINVANKHGINHNGYKNGDQSAEKPR